jgi:16S rRNA (guanine966-N2)-methyltransferase
VRITGGTWRSRRLRGPGRRLALRPTPDSLRERGFAVLGERVVDVRFLDLYAGTGAIGFEALSRGARQVVFVEHDRRAVSLIESNRAALSAETSMTRILMRPTLRAIKELAQRGERFGLAWADPPYESWLEGIEAVALAFETGILVPDAVACLECPDKADVALKLPPSLDIERDLKGGASRLVLIAARPPDH